MTKADEIKNLTETLIRYQDSYYKEGISLVPDIEYDRLFDELKRAEEEYPEFALINSPTKRVGSDLTNDFPEFHHTIPVLSLDKAYSKEEVLSFFSKSIQKEGTGLSFAAEEKIDGISIVLYYEDGALLRAVTRGNGEVGNDVTANIMTVPSVPLRLTERESLAVRGEIYLPKAAFEAFNARLEREQDRAANPRNLAAGTVRRLRSSEAAQVPLDIFCYEGFWRDSDKAPKDHLHILARLKELGFRTNPHLAFFAESESEAYRALSEASLEGRAYSFSELESFLREKSEERASLSYEIDGLVFKIDELDVRERFGYTEHHPRWAIAYKFESPQAEATLLSVTCQVGRTGRVTPVAEITPTELSGSVIRRATLHNQEYINELELAIGDRVSIVKRGDVIPAVEEVIEKNSLGNTTYTMPKHCPSCNSELVFNGAHLYCPAPDCPDQAKGKITYFASRNQMDIESLGPKTVELLYNKGILKSIEDIYSADYSRLYGTEGIGEKTIELLKRSVEESKAQPFRVLFSALALSDIGSKSVDAIVSAGFNSFDKLIKAAQRRDITIFTAIKGIGESTAETLVEAFNDERLLRTIEILASFGLHTSEEQDKGEERLEAIFSGQTWVATGSFVHFNPRSKALKEIERRGGKTSSSLSGRTTHLLVGSGGGSKRAEAERLGIRLVNEEEFLALLGVEDKSEDVEPGMLL